MEKCLITPSGKIHYWVTDRNSEKPWLVFLPGLTADHHLFDQQTAVLTDHNCLVWDAPAHGSSRPFALNFTMEAIADYLHVLLEREGIRDPVLIGQSLGGYIAQCYILKYPDSISAFVSIDSSPLSRRYFSGWELALLKDTRWMYEMIPWKLLLEWGIWGTSRSSYGRQLMRDTWAAYSRDEFLDLTVHGYRITAEAIEARPAYPLSCPVLLLCGEKDAAGSARRYNRRWSKAEGHKLIWLKGAGHNANTDVPEEVNRRICEFVR